MLREDDRWCEAVDAGGLVIETGVEPVMNSEVVGPVGPGVGLPFGGEVTRTTEMVGVKVRTASDPGKAPFTRALSGCWFMAVC